MFKMNISWTAKQIAKMMKNNLFSFDNLIQRSYVWEQKRKSDLIHSMIEGYPIPPFYAKRVDGKVYDFLDGKQRMSAIAGYINGEYYLDGIPEVTYINDNGEEVTEDINGVLFENLPEVLQDTIKDYTLTIYYYENITDFQVREMFRKLNNGKPLSAKERNIANMIDISNISELGKHTLFSSVFTQKGIDSRKHLPVIMKVWCMLNQDVEKVSFDSVKFNEVVSETMTTEEEREEISACFDYYREAIHLVTDRAVYKKCVKETNLVSIMPFVRKAIEESVSEKLFSEWLVNIFSGEYTVSVDYMNAAVSGAAKNGNIVIRDEELAKAWDEFFKEDKVESEKPDDAEDVTENIEYKYGMRIRGFSIGCQPMDGFVRREDATNNNYLDVLVYNRELSEDEMEHYSLDRVA